MKNRLLFIGPPGAGKGTQAQMICNSNDFCHLSTGELLRAEVASGTDVGRKAAELMSRGELVKDELVLQIVRTRLDCLSGGWLLDGFPRNVSQAASLDQLLADINQQIELVILLKLDDSALLQRLILRGRDDDTEEIIANRIEVYHQKTAPLIEFYTSQGLLEVVDADGTVNDVNSRIKSIL